MVFVEPFADRQIMGPYNQLEAELVLEVALSLARYLCDGDKGRREGDPLFDDFVSEGRQRGNSERRARGIKEVPYSGCGDLCHFILWSLLGAGTADLGEVRKALARKVINREEAWGWVVQVNTSRLRYDTKQHFKVFDHSTKGKTLSAPNESEGQLLWSPPPGSIFLLGEHGTEHVAVVEEVSGDEFVSFDYGQFFQTEEEKKKGLPGRNGGRRVRRKLFRHPVDKRLWAKGQTEKPVMGHLDVVGWLQAIIDADQAPLDVLIARGAPL